MTSRLDPRSLPLVGRAYGLGVHPLTTTLVLLGPLLIAALAVFGRRPVTVALAVAYVGALPVSVAYLHLRDLTAADGTGAGADDGETNDDGSDGETAADGSDEESASR